MPYSYTLVWQARRYGLPTMRPLVLNYPDDPNVPNMKYTFQQAFAEILPHNVPEYFFQKTPAGELEFAVPGWDVTSAKYMAALEMGKAPLSDKLTLRRISAMACSRTSAFCRPTPPGQISTSLATRSGRRVA